MKGGKLMDFSNYINIIVMLACLLVGYIAKHWISDVDNKWIPTMVFLLGITLQFTMAGVSVENFVIGGLSGLASTGMHQLFKSYVERQ